MAAFSMTVQAMSTLSLTMTWIPISGMDYIQVKSAFELINHIFKENVHLRNLAH